MFQNLNSQITNELSEPSPFVNWKLSVMLKITQGSKHKRRAIDCPLVSLVHHQHLWIQFCSIGRIIQTQTDPTLLHPLLCHR